MAHHRFSRYFFIRRDDLFLLDSQDADSRTRIGLPEVGLGVNYIGYVTVLAVSFSATHFLHFRTSLGSLISFFSVAGATLATLLTQTKGTLLGFVPLLSLYSSKERGFSSWFQ